MLRPLQIRLRFHPRQVHGERGALSRRALDGDVAAALLHDAVDGREPQARAASGFLRREEGLEDLGPGLLVHARPRVHDRERDVGAGLDAFSSLAKLHVGGLDRDLPALGHRVPCIHDQVHEDLLDLSGVRLDPPQIFPAPERQLDVGADETPQHALDAVDHHVQVEHLGLEHLAAAEGEELARERGRAQGRLLHLADLAQQLVLGSQLPLDHLAVAQDRGQDVVEVVGHAPGEPPHGFHLLRLAELLLQALALGAGLRLAQLALDGRRQAIEISLHHVIVRARPHGRDRGLFSDRSGDEDERQLPLGVANQREGLGAFEPRNVVIGDDDVPPARLERRAQGRLGVDAQMRDLVARPLELANREMAVGLGILDDENLEFLIAHSRSSAPAAAGSAPASRVPGDGPPP